MAAWTGVFVHVSCSLPPVGAAALPPLKKSWKEPSIFKWDGTKCNITLTSFNELTLACTLLRFLARSADVLTFHTKVGSGWSHGDGRSLSLVWLWAVINSALWRSNTKKPHLLHQLFRCFFLDLLTGSTCRSSQGWGVLFPAGLQQQPCRLWQD